MRHDHRPGRREQHPSAPVDRRGQRASSLRRRPRRRRRATRERPRCRCPAAAGRRRTDCLGRGVGGRDERSVRGGGRVGRPRHRGRPYGPRAGQGRMRLAPDAQLADRRQRRLVLDGHTRRTGRRHGHAQRVAVAVGQSWGRGPERAVAPRGRPPLARHGAKATRHGERPRDGRSRRRACPLSRRLGRR